MNINYLRSKSFAFARFAKETTTWETNPPPSGDVGENIMMFSSPQVFILYIFFFSFFFRCFSIQLGACYAICLVRLKLAPVSASNGCLFSGGLFFRGGQETKRESAAKKRGQRRQTTTASSCFMDERELELRRAN